MRPGVLATRCVSPPVPHQRSSSAICSAAQASLRAQVLVDPSCSGSGMRNGHSSVISEQEVAELVLLQTSVLRHALSFPKAARVVYRCAPPALLLTRVRHASAAAVRAPTMRRKTRAWSTRCASVVVRGLGFGFVAVQIYAEFNVASRPSKLRFALRFYLPQLLTDGRWQQLCPTGIDAALDNTNGPTSARA